MQRQATVRHSELTVHDRARRDPARARKPPSARSDGATGDDTGGVARYVLRVLLRIRVLRGGLGDACLVVGAIGELQHAAMLPRCCRIRLDACRPLPLRVQKAGAGQARKQAVVARYVRLVDTGAQARCRGGWRTRALDHVDIPASRGKPRRYGRTRESGADDHGPSHRQCTSRGMSRRRRRPARCVSPHQHFALGAEARAAVGMETRGAERVAHRAGDAPGRQRRAGLRHPGQRFHRARRPHVGIAPRRESVEIERVRVEQQLRQRSSSHRQRPASA